MASASCVLVRPRWPQVAEQRPKHPQPAVTFLERLSSSCSKALSSLREPSKRRRDDGSAHQKKRVRGAPVSPSSRSWQCTRSDTLLWSQIGFALRLLLTMQPTTGCTPRARESRTTCVTARRHPAEPRAAAQHRQYRLDIHHWLLTLLQGRVALVPYAGSRTQCCSY